MNKTCASADTSTVSIKARACQQYWAWSAGLARFIQFMRGSPGWLSQYLPSTRGEALEFCRRGRERPVWGDQRSRANRPDQCQVAWDPVSHELNWQGEITAANAARAWQMTRQYLHTLNPLPRTLRINLSGLCFIDNDGLGLMIRFRNFARDHGISIKFTQPQYRVRRVIQLARLESHLLTPSRTTILNRVPSSPRPAPAPVSPRTAELTRNLQTPFSGSRL